MSLRNELHFKAYGNNFEVNKMDEKTIKGNLSEQYINDMSNNSFIKYWCYPNPNDDDGDKKEICDLLVLFNPDSALEIFRGKYR